MILKYGEKLEKKNQLILVGAGYIGRQAAQFFEEKRVKYFADNSVEKIGTRIEEVPVIAMSDLPGLEKEYDIVIASTQYLQEFAEQLKTLGIEEFYRFTDGFSFEIEEALAPYLGQKIALYGTGDYAESVLNVLGKSRVRYVIDDPKDGKVGAIWNGYTVKTIEEIAEEVDCVFVGEQFPRGFVGNALMRNIPNRKFRIVDVNEFQFGIRQLITNNYLHEGFEAKDEATYSERVVQNTEMNRQVSLYVSRISEMERIPLFRNVELETHNKCNGVCSFCPANRNNDTRETQYMSEGLFEKIIFELAELDYDGKLFMYCNDEPLMDERIERFVKFARQRLPKTRILFSTNGILLTLDRFKEIIPYVDDFRLNNYNDRLELIPSAVKVREYCLEHPELVRKTTILMRKANEILSSRGGDAPNRSELVSHAKETCGEPYRTMIIRPTGKVSLCSSDVLGKYTLGDVSKDTMKAVWYGEGYREIREKLKTGRGAIAQCEYCDWVSMF